MRKFDNKGQGQFTLGGFEKLRFFGGSYCTKRKFRVARPLSTKDPMHLVLRSSKAKGIKSFVHSKNRKRITNYILKCAKRWGIKIEQLANVGNHIHLLIRISSRRGYKPFICALTGGIAVLVNGSDGDNVKFWDYRPFSRIIYGLKALLTMKDYVAINQYEGNGTDRAHATMLVKGNRVFETG